MIDEIHLDRVNSTQKWAKDHLSSFNRNKMTTITAEEQTEGIGRRGRKWFSPRSDNIYATFFFTLPINTLHIQCLALVLAFCLAKVLKKHGHTPLVRWPNDVLLSEKKLSGILCETQIEEKGIDVFLGIGINVNMDKEELKTIDKPATSLFVETKKRWDRSILLTELQVQFKADLKQFLENGFAPFHDSYETLLAYRGKEVILDDGEKRHTGKLHSISSEGELQLLLPSKEIITLMTGDLSLNA